LKTILKILFYSIFSKLVAIEVQRVELLISQKYFDKLF